MGTRHLLTTYNVQFLKTNSGKKGAGMPVVRNQQFFFREGFCWNNVLTTYIKCRMKGKTVQSTESMSFFSCAEQTPEYYLISVMNSRLIALYVDDFVNATSHCTTGDAKLIPIVIPDTYQLSKCKKVFDKAYSLKMLQNDDCIDDIDVASKLEAVENENDQLINELYMVQT